MQKLRGNNRQFVPFVAKQASKCNYWSSPEDMLNHQLVLDVANITIYHKSKLSKTCTNCHNSYFVVSKKQWYDYKISSAAEDVQRNRHKTHPGCRIQRNILVEILVTALVAVRFVTHIVFGNILFQSQLDDIRESVCGINLEAYTCWFTAQSIAK